MTLSISILILGALMVWVAVWALRPDETAQIYKQTTCEGRKGERR